MKDERFGSFDLINFSLKINVPGLFIVAIKI
jgi:hypothetical protein